MVRWLVGKVDEILVVCSVVGLVGADSFGSEMPVFDLVMGLRF